MRPKTIVSIVGAAAALGTGGIAATSAIAQSSSSPASASAQASRFARHIEGPIIGIDRAARTFTVRDREHRNALSTVKVTRKTRFDNVAGFGALHKGQQVDVRAVRSNGTLSATKVESSGRVTGRVAQVGDDRGTHREAEVGDDRGADRGAEVNDDRGHDGRGHDAGDDRGHSGHRGHDR
jgi:Cu/Ag efflux protein CusF